MVAWQLEQRILIPIGSAINIFPQRHHSCEVRTVCIKKCFSQSLEKTVIMSLNYQQSKQLKLQNVF